MVQVAVEIIVAVKAMLVDERRNHAGLEEITTKLSFPECLPFCRPECLRISRKHTSVSLVCDFGRLYFFSALG